MLEGQDLGGAVGAFFGNDFVEYEWGWVLAPDRLHRLLDALGVAVDSPDLLGQVGHRLKLLEESEMEGRFKEAGATFWSRVGD